MTSQQDWTKAVDYISRKSTSGEGVEMLVCLNKYFLISVMICPVYNK